MSEQTDKAGVSVLDTVKLVLAVAALLAGVVGFYWFEDAATVLRLLCVLGGVALAAALTFWSAPGQELWQYVQGSRVELRKMVWPTRQETLQTTLIVFVFVVAMGIFFWLIDMLLAWSTRYATGQGG